MPSESKPKSQPLPGQCKGSIPEHLVESVRAIGDAVAAGGLNYVPIPSSPETKNSPEDLAKLVDRLQKTFGARGNANAAAAAVAGSKGKSGQVAPPPSPFALNHNADVHVGGKAKQRSKYHAYMEEIQDEDLAKKA